MNDTEIRNARTKYRRNQIIGQIVTGALIILLIIMIALMIYSVLYIPQNVSAFAGIVKPTPECQSRIQCLNPPCPPCDAITTVTPKLTQECQSKFPCFQEPCPPCSELVTVISSTEKSCIPPKAGFWQKYYGLLKAISNTWR
ncbi:MAG TPA: hypothetical protein VFF49_06655 [Thermodesulfobacteriota bacterium]|nr:hypothetical protein [Thermodesulfobacteriota bacterium]